MVDVIIPARFGSKGLPGKNMKRIGDFTLIEIAILQARQIFKESRVIVSTDSKMIAENIALPCTIVYRDEKLSNDKAGTMPVLKHVVEQTKSESEWFCLLQVTHPFRDILKIRNQLDHFYKSGCQSAMTGVYSDAFRWQDSNRVDHKTRERRQDRPTTWNEDGCFYLFNKDFVNHEDWLFDGIFLMDNMPGQVDIHTQEDLDYARKLFNKELCL